MTQSRPGPDYLDAADGILRRIRETQLGAVGRAADVCAATIAGGGLVHMFATGHSRMFIEEMFPRHGSFAGFHPIVELSLTYHTVVVGANGQRQAMYLEHVEGLGEVILRNFVLKPPDSFIVFSNSGVNELVVEVARIAKRRGFPVISVASHAHCAASRPRHSSGQTLPEVADVAIDSCAPAGDAMVRVDGVADPVGPGSTLAMATITNLIKVETAERLARLGKPPLVLSSGVIIGEAASAARFEAVYDDYRERVKRVYGG